jgi:hypothetical protein
MTWKDLKNQANQYLSKAGYYEDDTLLYVYIVGEVIDIAKLHKKGRRADVDLLERKIEKYGGGQGWLGWYDEHIKDTVEHCVCVTLIMISGYCEHRNLEPGRVDEYLKDFGKKSINDSFNQLIGDVGGGVAMPKFVYSCIKEMRENTHRADDGILVVLYFLGIVSKTLDIDVDRVLQHKVKYNKFKIERKCF